MGVDGAWVLGPLRPNLHLVNYLTHDNVGRAMFIYRLTYGVRYSITWSSPIKGLMSCAVSDLSPVCRGPCLSSLCGLSARCSHSRWSSDRTTGDLAAASAEAASIVAVVPKWYRKLANWLFQWGRSIDELELSICNVDFIDSYTEVTVSGRTVK